jgi:hypothetical protein
MRLERARVKSLVRGELEDGKEEVAVVLGHWEARGMWLRSREAEWQRERRKHGNGRRGWRGKGRKRSRG